ncbi:2'-5' RNA ligase [Allocatelliglobosispora scoriae]|uniref:RNA 2',3'-cyclic phosphodiesterase n=1 Tax=Allocatelliglobosispora scoriae TaxID=643052 RepID=A0A841BZ20_9ACTN|nr:RNA 2',3'-cyclic phosphodiesterase [Allocatelliglobosispora scoriae]MBB5872738.1 2'-5' RNA ligase [Allocatelliglobosispora scoriae]
MPTEQRRLFIAAYPPPAAIGDLAALVAGLTLAQPHPDSLSRRPVPPDQWHVTLAFLGEVPVDRIDAVTGAMTAAAARSRPPAPRLRLTGGGWFDNLRAAAIWIGVDGDLDALHALVAGLREELAAAELPVDERPYQPHLTLGRPGRRLSEAERRGDLDRLDDYAGPVWTLGELALMLGDYPDGNDYTRIFTAPMTS